MDLRSSGLSVSKALVGFLNTKAAEGQSPRTLQNYEHRLNHWIDYACEVDVSKVTPQLIRRSLGWMRTEYKPKRFNGDDQPLSPKSIRNVYVTLSSFFAWASAITPGPMNANFSLSNIVHLRAVDTSLP